MESDKKIILTTEKDAMRLEMHKTFLRENKMPVFALQCSVGKWLKVNLPAVGNFAKPLNRVTSGLFSARVAKIHFLH